MADVEPVTAGPPHPIRVPLASQGWRDVVFLHWPCRPHLVRPLLPPRTEPDLFDGRAWIGVVGIRMTWMRALAVPVLPFLGRIVELNVRTYCVDSSGRRGVAFLTMEASHPPFVLLARTLGRLPYRLATVDHSGTGPDIGYRSDRIWPAPARAGMRLRARPEQEVDPTEFDHFATDRWRVHSRWYGRTLRMPIAHEPWRLHAARLLDFDDHGLLADAGLPTPTDVPSVRYSPGVDTKFGVPAFLAR